MAENASKWTEQSIGDRGLSRAAIGASVWQWPLCTLWIHRTLSCGQSACNRSKWTWKVDAAERRNCCTAKLDPTTFDFRLQRVRAIFVSLVVHLKIDDSSFIFYRATTMRVCRSAMYCEKSLSHTQPHTFWLRARSSFVIETISNSTIVLHLLCRTRPLSRQRHTSRTTHSLPPSLSRSLILDFSFSLTAKYPLPHSRLQAHGSKQSEPNITGKKHTHTRTHVTRESGKHGKHGRVYGACRACCSHCFWGNVRFELTKSVVLICVGTWSSRYLCVCALAFFPVHFSTLW